MLAYLEFLAYNDLIILHVRDTALFNMNKFNFDVDLNEAFLV